MYLTSIISIFCFFVLDEFLIKFLQSEMFLLLSAVGELCVQFSIRNPPLRCRCVINRKLHLSSRRINEKYHLYLMKKTEAIKSNLQLCTLYFDWLSILSLAYSSLLMIFAIGAVFLNNSNFY